jgi:hypothetical protein
MSVDPVAVHHGAAELTPQPPPGLAVEAHP